ncbi:MAG: hypothetical protein IJG80_05695 [Selenomonadaceae bacterium]|nr:hypothetical protein [Selenomonadaceae bacterium]
MSSSYFLCVPKESKQRKGTSQGRWSDGSKVHFAVQNKKAGSIVGLVFLIRAAEKIFRLDVLTF